MQINIGNSFKQNKIALFCVSTIELRLSYVIIALYAPVPKKQQEVAHRDKYIGSKF